MKVDFAKFFNDVDGVVLCACRGACIDDHYVTLFDRLFHRLFKEFFIVGHSGEADRLSAVGFCESGKDVGV